MAILVKIDNEWFGGIEVDNSTGELLVWADKKGLVVVTVTSIQAIDYGGKVFDYEDKVFGSMNDYWYYRKWFDRYKVYHSALLAGHGEFEAKQIAFR